MLLTSQLDLALGGLPPIWFLAMSLVWCGSGPFRAVGIDVRSTWVGSPAQRVVEVQFWKPGDCFVVPDGTRVALNGEALQLVSAGGRKPDTSGLRRPDAIRGIEIAAPNCEPALFRSQPFVPTPARSDRIYVELSGHSGAVEIEGLLAERTLRLVSGPVERGKPVTLEWTPRSDVWPSRIVGAEVQIADAGQKTILITGPALRVKQGRFQFQMADVSSNRVALSVNPGATWPYARVRSCRGFRECLSREVMGPAPLEVEVVAAPSSAAGH